MIRLTDPADWAPALRSMQAAAEMNSTDLAEAAGITRPHVSNMRWGGFVPSFQAALRIAAALGYDLALIPKDVP